MVNLRNRKKSPLLWLSVSLIIITTAGIIALIVFQENEWQKDIARQYIERSTEKTLNALKTLKKPVEHSLLIGRKWGLAGLYNLNDAVSLSAKFIPIMEELFQLSGMMLTDTDEEEYFLMPDSGFWLVRSWARGEPPDKVRWLQLDSLMQIRHTWKAERKFLPSSRPWFALALPAVDSARVSWYGPYMFLTKKMIGLTGSIAWKDQKTAKKYVLAFDVLLDELMREISAAKITAHTVNFLFNKRGMVLTPQDSLKEKHAIKSSNPAIHYSQCSNMLVRKYVEKWLRDSLKVVQPVELLLNKQVYWGSFHQISDHVNDTFIATVLSEDDFQSEVNNRIIMTSVWVFLIILVSTLMGYFLYRKYGRAKETDASWLIDKDNPRQSILDKIRQGEGRFVEFKSTMRMNLKAGKPGKEIELAWLKTVAAFMNSEGGVLFIGVDDAGNVLGLDADGFENEDRCRLHFKNVFNQHIGVEFSPYVKLDIYDIDGKDVACVQCSRSKEPVFVKTKNDEEIFYIRSGPSTVKLPPSKIMKYMRQRKK